MSSPILGLLIATWGIGFCACSQGSSQSSGSQVRGSMERPGAGSNGTVSRPRATAGTPGGVADLFVLRDVQGLWGGRDLWIRGDRKAWVQFVGRAGKVPGFGTARHEFTVSSAQLEALRKRIKSQRFFTIATRKRSGVPDEARPLIYVKLGAREAAKAKWSNDKHPRFDALYELLLRMAIAGRSGKKRDVSKRDHTWSPPGFPALGRLLKLAGDPTR